MRKFIVLILVATLLSVFLIGCSSEPEPELVPPLTAIGDGLQDLAEIEATQPDEDLIDPDLNENDQPTPPPRPTEEEAKQFAESLDLFNLPFDIPLYFSADGAHSRINDITCEEENELNPFLEFDIFLLDLIEGHWIFMRPAADELYEESPYFQWHGYSFTKELGALPSERIGDPAFDRVLYRMSRFDRNTGEEQPGVFGGSVLFQPEYSRIEFITFIYLDNHNSITDPAATFTEVITWHFYADDLSIAFGNFMGLVERDPVTDEPLAYLPMIYTRG